MIYNFIDIGTSDFRYTVPKNNECGIYVEPISLYLNKIPKYKNTHKINVAICKSSGEFEISYIHPDVILDKKLPNWLRGCNQMYGTHPTIIKECLKKNIDCDSVLTRETVKCITLNELFETFNVTEVIALKIDTEGYDCDIVLQAIDLTNNGIKIHSINFESNQLTDKEIINDTCNKLINNGWEKTIPDGIHDTKFLYRGNK